MNNIFEDVKLLDLTENCLTNYSYDIAKLVYYLYKEKYPNWRRLRWGKFRCSNNTHGNQ